MKYIKLYKEHILNTRLKNLGWKEKTNFEEGIKKSYEYYIRNGEKW